MKFLRTALAGLLAGLSFAASAQVAVDPALANYVSTTYGTGKVGLNCPANTSCSPVDAAFAMRLGHRFDPAWAVELGYLDISSDFAILIQRYSASLKSYSLGAAFTLPLSNSVSAQMRAGLSSNKLRFQPPFSPGDVTPYSKTTNSVKPYVGVVASWQFARQLLGDNRDRRKRAAKLVGSRRSERADRRHPLLAGERQLSRCHRVA